jgi:hypothetical protein
MAEKSGPYNELPDDFEGEQKRRTIFSSPEDKIGYDARGLIMLAKDEHKKDDVTVEEALALAKRGKSNPDGGDTLAVIEKLRRAISIEIQGDQLCNQFINRLGLLQSEAFKLKEMMSMENYLSAVATAKELDPECKIPTYAQIIETLISTSPEKLKNACEMMEKPTLLIVSPNSFDDKIAAMNAHKYFISADGKSQEDAFVNRDHHSPFNDIPKAKKTVVSITDGAVHPSRPVGYSRVPGGKRNQLASKFAARGLKHIGVNEMATLIQKSLREADQARDNRLVVDNWEDGIGTTTLLDPKSLAKSTAVAVADFYSSDQHQACFDHFPSKESLPHLRGRATMQLMEY